MVWCQVAFWNGYSPLCGYDERLMHLSSGPSWRNFIEIVPHNYRRHLELYVDLSTWWCRYCLQLLAVPQIEDRGTDIPACALGSISFVKYKNRFWWPTSPAVPFVLLKRQLTRWKLQQRGQTRTGRLCPILERCHNQVCRSCAVWRVAKRKTKWRTCNHCSSTPHHLQMFCEANNAG